MGGMPTTTNHFQTLAAKKPGDELTLDELACSLYEGTPHLQNLAETLARQHGQAGALTFFDMMGDDVRNFWRGIAKQLIDHAKEWQANQGGGCVLSDQESKRLKELPFDLIKELGRLREWVHDLQSGMFINCVYCGHRYGPDDEVPSTMADALKEHVEQCPDHPMSKLRAEVVRLEKLYDDEHDEADRFLDEMDMILPDGGGDLSFESVIERVKKLCEK